MTTPASLPLSPMFENLPKLETPKKEASFFRRLLQCTCFKKAEMDGDDIEIVRAKVLKELEDLDQIFEKKFADLRKQIEELQ